MYKTVLRAAPRQLASSRSAFVNTSSRRLLSTAPPTRKSRSLKSSFARWGIAGGLVYLYNTSTIFEGEPEAAIQSLNDSIHNVQESNLPTVDAIVLEKRAREAQQAEENKKTDGNVERVATAGGEDAEDGEGEGGLEGLEEEAGQQGAFNPETGEINWDCPCLGGMAHGPCGEQFQAAFSCFVYSTEEPKGVECIEKFQGMQDCFRQHPEMYGSELEDDEDDVEEEVRAQQAARAQDGPESQTPRSEVPKKDSATEIEGKPSGQESTPPKVEKQAPVERETPPKKEVTEASKPKETESPVVGEPRTSVPKPAHNASSE